MKGFYIFIMRAVVGIAFAAVLSRAFYPGKPVIYVAGLAFFLILMAYVFEYFRKRKRFPK